MLKIAAAQMNSREKVARNLESALKLINQAAREGVALLGLPENFLYIGPDRRFCLDLDGPEVSALQEAVQKAGLHLVAGSIPERIGGEEKRHYNTSLLFGPDGALLASYRKIHLFDVDLPSNAKPLRESNDVLAGASAVVADTALGKLGLTICYDLRFPELYRLLALSGAELIALPANFTEFTGKDHWLPLLRARAIENQVYILAPAQYGAKYEDNVSYGKAAVVDPWGSVLALAADRDEALAVAVWDKEYQAEVRGRMPCLGAAILMERLKGG